MKHIKLFESTNIDKEEIKLWMVDLLDEDFKIIILNPYEYANEIVDGVCIKILRQEQYIVSDFIEVLYFVTDMMKRRYNLNLSHISLLSNLHSGYGLHNYIQTVETVRSFDSIIDSTMTSDHAIGIYYEPEPKGLNKYVQKFLDFNPVHKISNFPVNMVMKGAEKLNKYLKSKK
jgi:hypothetical protein